METNVEFYREGGQWKMRIALPRWVIDDILRDSEMHNRVVFTLHQCDELPGHSLYNAPIPLPYGSKNQLVLGTARFEVTNVEPKRDE